MKRIFIAFVLGMIVCAAHADIVSEIDTDTAFYISTGFDIHAKTRAEIDVMGYKFSEVQKYKFDAPNISAGVDIFGIEMGVNLSWRDVDGLYMRNTTYGLELPIIPYGIAPYIIGEIGSTDIKFDMPDIKFHDRAFMYGYVIGIRVSMSNNTFIKIYQIWSRARLHDSMSDMPIKISACHSRAGFAVGWSF